MFLVHDFLFARNGIVAPVAHPLRQAVEKHKTRLRGEFAKARVRRGCTSVEELKDAILREKKGALGQSQSQETVYPRWVRVNNLRTTLEEQLDSTFKTYRRVSSIAQLVEVPDGLYIDRHIPDLLAVASGVDFSNSPAYKNGEIILQDKASCFPAYLLLGDKQQQQQEQQQWKGDLIDACAAPGNKTTHLASLLHKHRTNSRIISMDSSPARSKTLQKMITQAGADDTVTVLPGQDFLALDPNEDRFANVTGLLLDPSCSGSGIVGRDDVPSLSLPVANRFMTSRDSVKGKDKGKDKGKKRKRGQDDNHNHGDINGTNNNTNDNTNENENDTNNNTIDTTRLTKLSNLQTHILERALSYPSATRVTYSTCSIHQIENEGVVSRVLGSEVAKRRSWRLLRRDEQPSGLREWRYRGVGGGGGGDGDRPGDGLAKVNLSELELEACLRCWHGEEGLGGFFVVGFVRDGSEGEDGDEEWEGFSD